ncbi:MAG: 5'-3' exonuclease [Actinomycetota bacterium]
MTHRLLLDVSSLAYRAYFALRDGPFTPEGAHVGAVHGYLDMVTRLIATRRPDEVVHVYDHDWRPMERTKIYPAYKGNRPPEPEGLPEQFLMIRRVLDATEMVQAQTEGWEAEDAIGAFCLDAREDDRLEIVSGDRDLIQLVRDPVVTLLFTVRGVTDLTTFDEAGVFAKYGVTAAQYGDFAILRGDPSDGLPGVRGVGQKTAQALVSAFGSLDAVLEAAEAGDRTIKPAVRARLLEARGYLDDMRRLVPVNADAPLSLWAGERDEAELVRLGAELSIKGPLQRLVAALEAAAHHT